MQQTQKYLDEYPPRKQQQQQQFVFEEKPKFNYAPAHEFQQQHQKHKDQLHVMGAPKMSPLRQKESQKRQKEQFNQFYLKDTASPDKSKSQVYLPKPNTGGQTPIAQLNDRTLAKLDQEYLKTNYIEHVESQLYHGQQPPDQRLQGSDSKLDDSKDMNLEKFYPNDSRDRLKETKQAQENNLNEIFNNLINQSGYTQQSDPRQKRALVEQSWVRTQDARIEESYSNLTYQQPGPASSSGRGYNQILNEDEQMRPNSQAIPFLSQLNQSNFHDSSSSRQNNPGGSPPKTLPYARQPHAKIGDTVNFAIIKEARETVNESYVSQPRQSHSSGGDINEEDEEIEEYHGEERDDDEENSAIYRNQVKHQEIKRMSLDQQALFDIQIAELKKAVEIQATPSPKPEPAKQPDYTQEALLKIIELLAQQKINENNSQNHGCNSCHHTCCHGQNQQHQPSYSNPFVQTQQQYSSQQIQETYYVQEKQYMSEQSQQRRPRQNAQQQLQYKPPSPQKRTDPEYYEEVIEEYEYYEDPRKPLKQSVKSQEEVKSQKEVKQPPKKEQPKPQNQVQQKQPPVKKPSDKKEAPPKKEEKNEYYEMYEEYEYYEEEEKKERVKPKQEEPVDQFFNQPWEEPTKEVPKDQVETYIIEEEYYEETFQFDDKPKPQTKPNDPIKPVEQRKPEDPKKPQQPEEKKPVEQKKPEEKKPEEKRPQEKNPVDPKKFQESKHEEENLVNPKKPEEKKPEMEKPVDPKKPEEKKPEMQKPVDPKKPEEKKPEYRTEAKKPGELKKEAQQQQNVEEIYEVVEEYEYLTEEYDVPKTKQQAQEQIANENLRITGDFLRNQITIVVREAIEEETADMTVELVMKLLIDELITQMCREIEDGKLEGLANSMLLRLMDRIIKEIIHEGSNALQIEWEHKVRDTSVDETYKVIVRETLRAQCWRVEFELEEEVSNNASLSLFLGVIQELIGNTCLFLQIEMEEKTALNLTNKLQDVLISEMIQIYIDQQIEDAVAVNATKQVEKRLMGEMITESSLIIQNEVENKVADEAVRRCQDLIINEMIKQACSYLLNLTIDQLAEEAVRMAMDRITKELINQASNYLMRIEEEKYAEKVMNRMILYITNDVIEYQCQVATRIWEDQTAKYSSDLLFRRLFETEFKIDCDIIEREVEEIAAENTTNKCMELVVQEEIDDALTGALWQMRKETEERLADEAVSIIMEIIIQENMNYGVDITHKYFLEKYKRLMAEHAQVLSFHIICKELIQEAQLVIYYELEEDITEKALRKVYMKIFSEMISEMSNEIEWQLMDHVSTQAVEKVRQQVTLELEEESVTIIVTDWFAEEVLNRIIKKLLQEYLDGCLVFQEPVQQFITPVQQQQMILDPVTGKLVVNEQYIPQTIQNGEYIMSSTTNQQYIQYQQQQYLQQQMPQQYQQMPPPYQQMPPPYQQMPPTYQQMPPPYQQQPNQQQPFQQPPPQYPGYPPQQQLQMPEQLPQMQQQISTPMQQTQPLMGMGMGAGTGMGAGMQMTGSCAFCSHWQHERFSLASQQVLKNTVGDRGSMQTTLQALEALHSQMFGGHAHGGHNHQHHHHTHSERHSDGGLAYSSLKQKGSHKGKHSHAHGTGHTHSQKTPYAEEAKGETPLGEERHSNKEDRRRTAQAKAPNNLKQDEEPSFEGQESQRKSQAAQEQQNIPERRSTVNSKNIFSNKRESQRDSQRFSNASQKQQQQQQQELVLSQRNSQQSQKEGETRQPSKEEMEQFNTKILEIIIKKENFKDPGTILQLRELMYSGLSKRMRRKLWKHIIFVNNRNLPKDITPEIYNGKLTNQNNCACLGDIMKDVPRTFQNHPRLRCNDETAPDMPLTRILVAYANYDKEIGYAQGMNYIAGVFLIVLKDEFLAFLALYYIMFNINWRSIYSKNLQKLKNLLEIIDRKVFDESPKVWDMMKKQDVKPEGAFSQLLITIGLYNCPFDTACQIMDLYLVEGEKVLYRILLSCIRINQKKILEMKDQMVVYQFLQKYMIPETINQIGLRKVLEEE